LRRAVAREPLAWQRLMSLYSPLVRYWCRQAGIAEQDVADVSQEVFAAIASSLATFDTGRQGTTFRAWMRGIARHKLMDHVSRRRELAAGGTDAYNRLLEVPARQNSLELSESPAEVNSLYQRALRLVRDQFEDRTFTAFWRVTVENHSPVDVARDLGITANAVRQAKSRVLRRLKEEIGELIA
jgi:RNA polymerase sigma-70 factor (ECF subfamily)